MFKMKSNFEITKDDTPETLRKRLSGLADTLFLQLPIGKWCMEIKKPTITEPQRKGLHLYCTWLADLFNENSIPFVESCFGKDFEVNWDKDRVKRAIFHRMLKAMFDLDGTSKATTKQLCDVIDYVEKNLSVKLGIDCKFPNREDLEFNKYANVSR